MITNLGTKRQFWRRREKNAGAIIQTAVKAAIDGDMRAGADTLSAIRQRHVERELGRGRYPSGRSTKFAEARPVMPRTTMGADEMTPKRSGGSGRPDQSDTGEP